MRINIKDCIKNSLQKHVLSLIFVTHQCVGHVADVEGECWKSTSCLERERGGRVAPLLLAIAFGTVVGTQLQHDGDKSRSQGSTRCKRDQSGGQRGDGRCFLYQGVALLRRLTRSTRRSEADFVESLDEDDQSRDISCWRESEERDCFSKFFLRGR